MAHGSGPPVERHLELPMGHGTSQRTDRLVAPTAPSSDNYEVRGRAKRPTSHAGTGREDLQGIASFVRANRSHSSLQCLRAFIRSSTPLTLFLGSQRRYALLDRHLNHRPDGYARPCVASCSSLLALMLIVITSTNLTATQIDRIRTRDRHTISPVGWDLRLV